MIQAICNYTKVYLKIIYCLLFYNLPEKNHKLHKYWMIYLQRQRWIKIENAFEVEKLDLNKNLKIKDKALKTENLNNQKQTC